MTYKREERFRLTYIANGVQKQCFPRSKEKKDENLRVCKERGYKVVECVKLYPINTEANQHNFYYLMEKQWLRRQAMIDGEVEWSDKDYDIFDREIEELEELTRLALPVAWVDGKTYAKARDYIASAEMHRDMAQYR